MLSMRFSFFWMLLVINAVLTGEIITTNDFGCIVEACQGLDEKSLVLFDVDATLIVAQDAILSPRGKDLFKQLIAGHTDRNLFREIRMKAPHKLVDSRSIAFIHHLISRNIPVIAFTAAQALVKEQIIPGMWRVEELKRYGFDFSQSFPSYDYLELPKSEDQKQSPVYRQGVLYSSFHQKGDVLSAFLKHIDRRPDKVVFIDDEFVHVDSILTCMEKERIQCVGIHYTAANEIPCMLNPELARFQIEHFVKHGIWLSDDDVQNVGSNKVSVFFK